MAKYDRMSALFFVGLSLAICAESIRLGPGSLSNPGSGLIPLGCGLLLGILGAIVFLHSWRNSQGRKQGLWDQGTIWRNLSMVPLSMIGYAFLLDFLGFILVTFLWMSLICRVTGKMGWRSSIIASGVATLLCYLVFKHFLGVRFPGGVLGV